MLTSTIPDGTQRIVGPSAKADKRPACNQACLTSEKAFMQPCSELTMSFTVPATSAPAAAHPFTPLKELDVSRNAFQPSCTA